MTTPTTQPIEVEKVTLQGVIESIEPLSEEWHKQFVGLRVVGIDAKRIEQGCLEGKYFKATIKFENPFNTEYPIIQEHFPISEKNATGWQGERVKQEFYAYNNGLYEMTVEHPQRQGGGIDYLLGVTDNCKPLRINNWRVREERK